MAEAHQGCQVPEPKRLTLGDPPAATSQNTRMSEDSTDTAVCLGATSARSDLNSLPEVKIL